MKWITPFLALLFLNDANAHTDKLIATSQGRRVPLLELYSSESCSSCPPADDWIGHLQERDGLWKDFVPVVFHVDYWNDLGWKDAYSSSGMTKRQVSISDLWPHPRVYTPAMIYNGEEWTDWRKSKNQALPTAGEDLNIVLRLYKQKDSSVRIEVGGLKDTSQYEIHFTELGMGLVTKVSAGENSGRSLGHNFLILNWEHRPIDFKTKSIVFSLKPQDNSRRAVAVWIEKVGRPVALQAAGGYL